MHWMKFKWWYFLVSALVIVPGLVSLFRSGLRPAIDFTGGTLLELKFEGDVGVLKDEDIKKLIEEKGFALSAIQLTDTGTVLLRLKPISREEAEIIKSGLGEKFNQKPQEIRFETVGPTLGRELLVKTITGIVLAAIFILAYVARQFKDVRFGICAILAMFHDTLVLLGVFSLLGHYAGVEIDTLFVTAILTILSFSVHDTVVVYDRIRESQKLFSHVPLEDLVDKAITETLSRSLNNSLTIIFMLMALWLLGGETIRWFSVALLIGTVSGTYSSTFTAAPLLVVWEKLKKQKD